MDAPSEEVELPCLDDAGLLLPGVLALAPLPVAFAGLSTSPGPSPQQDGASLPTGRQTLAPNVQAAIAGLSSRVDPPPHGGGVPDKALAAAMTTTTVSPFYLTYERRPRPVIIHGQFALWLHSQDNPLP
ncbi:hypothetical protein E2562_003970 [Oryza meyeriana var. granulata]|uniref:Uncharacterized protein n=1 Tax=Oryza meyeriana var. granulata TaxID=110450 RepID=A0A6G1BIG5_9ORYZ|nr:hypothetical protein E2562_003970 [Oryza meyeriana var. granulata]